VFLRTTYPRLVGTVALVTGDQPAAEDAVQEALLRAWERTEPIERLDAWVVTVALNLTRSGLRRIGAERRARARLAPSGPPSSQSDARIDIERALSRLPRRQREVVVRRYVLDHTTAEIAASMGTSEGTVKSQLSKARVHLAQDLAFDPDEETDHADA
jgi:RNA polymerase sigma-70 factor (ECF subfamily)